MEQDSFMTAAGEQHGDEEAAAEEPPAVEPTAVEPTAEEAEEGPAGVAVTSFTGAIMSVISGTTRAESLARVLVDGAVRQVLGEVAAASGTTLEALMEAHGDRAVAMWTRADPRAREPRRPLEQLCTAMTRAKKPCSKPARVGTLCRWHAAAEQARANDENVHVEQRRQARVTAFQESLREMPPPPPPPMSQSVWSFSQQVLTQPY